MTPADSPSAAVAVVGMFDADDMESALTGRILVGELRARLPGADIRTFAPFGRERPTRLDGGEPSEPLGPWSPERAAAIAERFDAVLVVPPSDTRPGYPPELDGVDERMRWLGADAFEGSAAAVRALPGDVEPLVLAANLVEPDTLRKRLGFLRLMGWYPEDGPVTVVDHEGTLTARGPGAECPVPPELGVEDFVAVVGSADALEAASPFVEVLRRAFEDDAAPERAAAETWFDGFAQEVEKQRSVRTEHGARAAEARIVELEARLEALREAYEARGRRLVEERLVFADHVDELQREFGVTHEEVVRALREAEEARSEAERATQWAHDADEARRRADELRAQADANLERITSSRLYRFARALRRLVSLGRR